MYKRVQENENPMTLCPVTDANIMGIAMTNVPRNIECPKARVNIMGLMSKKQDLPRNVGLKGTFQVEEKGRIRAKAG
jgi:hypothetical protein